MDQFDVDPAKALASDLGQFARIRALTALRQEMVRCTDARYASVAPPAIRCGACPG